MSAPMGPFHPTRWPERLPQRYWLAQAKVPASLLEVPASQPVALLIEQGRIAAIEPRAPGGAATFDLQGALVFTAWVDVHTHLDKGDLLAAGLSAERDLFAAGARVRDDYARWTESELRTRIGFALRSALAHGTRALRSFVDEPRLAGALAWRVMRDLKLEWVDRLDLHLSSLTRIDELADAGNAETLARIVSEARAALGLFIYPGAPVELLPRAFDLAERFDLHLDFHVDEHLDPPLANLGPIARLARERGWGARTVCGHACVLGALAPAEREALLDEVAASGLALVSLPYTNLWLQDSGNPGTARQTPRRRGLLPLHEARARGIPLALGSDNHRDPFFPGGDLDPLQALALAANAAQLDDPAQNWADTITRMPAAMLGLRWDGVLRPGAPADLVLHPARHSAELCARAASGRQVLRAGQRLAGAAAMLPDFRELDGLRAPPR